MIPLSHTDLAKLAVPAVLVTLLADGRPQASVVWFDFVDEMFRFNSERGRLKMRNIERDPRVTLLILDPNNQHRYLEVRGDVVIVTETGAIEHRSELDRRYLGSDHYTDPASDKDIRLIVTIRPTKIIAYG